MLEIKILGLEALAEAVAELAAVLAIGKTPPVKVPEEIKVEAEVVKKARKKKKEEPVKEEPVKEEPVKEEKPTLSAEDVRKAFMDKNSVANRPKLKAILDDFGAPNVSALGEEHFEAVMARLEGI